MSYLYGVLGFNFGLLIQKILPILGGNGRLQLCKKFYFPIITCGRKNSML